MNKHLIGVALSGASAVVAALCALATPVVAHAGSAASTAAVSFVMPNNSSVTADAVPDIDFSPATVSGQAQTVAAHCADATVAVTNPGFASGWSVSVAASDFVSADAHRRIRSAQLTFASATVQAPGAVEAPAKTAPTTLTTGGDAVTLVSAAAHSVGQTTATYAASGIRLHIPAGNADANYSAKLNWTLSNAVQ